MKSFLDKIAQLSSVQHLLLLDLEGRLLYSFPSESTSDTIFNAADWRTLISGLGSPTTADVAFENGRFFMIQLQIGSLLVGVSHDEHAQTIKEGCATVREKLKDQVIRRNVLIRMFTEHRRAMKPQYIRGLKSVAGPEVADVLVPFLNTGDQLPEEARCSLISLTCEVLGLCRTKPALEALKSFLNSGDSESVKDPEVEKAAQIAIAQLELDKVGDVGESKAVGLAPAQQFNSAPDLEPNKLLTADQQIQSLIEQNKKTEAISLIMDLIREHAEKNDFAEAERYREMLLATDSMALQEIVSAAEIIENEKSAALDEALISTWDELIRALSLEEFSALFHATRTQSSAAGEIIAEQGDFLSNLFFVNSGRIQLYTSSNSRDTPFKTVEAGEIFGANSFFDISVWTYNARSLGATLSVLTWKRLAALKEDYPTLQDKLLEYCNRFRTDPAYFEKSSTSRRKYERRKLSGRATMELLQLNGSETGQIARGELIDISQGGVAFVLRFHRKEYTLDLLGKHVKVIIRPDNSPVPLQKNGMIKAVRSHDIAGNDYSIHLEFDELLGVSEVSQATDQAGN
jgi:CRP-like cAMP-binding protein